MILFKNPGSIDLRGLTTFGLSSKDDSQIGRFGTGLKYATAVIARHGGSLSIWTEGAWHDIGAETDEFRGKEIRQLTMDGARLPFTEELGRDWEPWMAFRELYSNALDEGGEVTRAEARPSGQDGETIIAVEGLDAFEAIFFTMEEHFISPDDVPVWESDEIAIYPGRSKFVFYRGIAIMKLKAPSAYRYALKGYVDLTEDRTAKYEWDVRRKIAKAIMGCDSASLAEVACDQRNEFEATLDFSEVSRKPTPEFVAGAVAAGTQCTPTAAAVVKAQMPSTNDSVTVYSTKQPGGKALMNACRILRDLGGDLSKVKFALADGVSMIGDYTVQGDVVFISDKVFDKQERMNIAVISAYADIVRGHWLARSAISLVQKNPEEAA